MNLFLYLYRRWPQATVQVTSHIIAISIVTVAAMLVLNLYAYATTQAAGEEPAECPIVGKADNATLYRCEDWEAGKVCYLNSFGFLFCLEE